MALSYFFTALLCLSLISAVITGQTASLAPAMLRGAQQGAELLFSMAGALCLWSGLSSAMEKTGLSEKLQKVLRPLLGRIFPQTAKDSVAMGYLCGNFTANLLGLGNAATPMGIRAIRQMSKSAPKNTASHEMCRLIVLNTASVQLIPATVCALRASLGAENPFAILPAVWVSSLLSASAGVMMTFLWEKMSHV
ncbi:MAG: spore maturation protein A [Oscillospiraceae bacterium]|nr:spore maturation protein A [Oscillospiraceae bacterium]